MGPSDGAQTEEVKRYVGLGWILWDHVMCLPTYPLENQKAPASSYFGQVGGPAVRALMLLRRFGAAVRLIGAVGDDSIGSDAIGELRRRDIDVGSVHIDPATRTRVAQVWLARETGSRTVAYSSTGPELRRLDPQSLDGVSAVLLDGRHAHQAEPLVNLARDTGVVVSMDMGGFKENLPDLIANCDVLIGSMPTWARLAETLGCDGPVDVMRRLRGTTSVLTQGPERVVAVRGDDVMEYLPRPVDAVDSNGAGDVFFGSFVWAHTNGFLLAEAVRFASAAAALKCTRLGNDGLPALGEVDDFLASSSALQ